MKTRKKAKKAGEKMKVKCLDCDESFELDKNEYDEGDLTECPECAATFIIKVKNGKFALASEKDKYDEYDLSEFNEDEDLPSGEE